MTPTSRSDPREKVARNAQIYRLRLAGATLDEIARLHGITRARVATIVHRKELDEILPPLTFSFLSHRAARALRKAGIADEFQLGNLRLFHLVELRGLGPKILSEIVRQAKRRWRGVQVFDERDINPIADEGP